MSEPVKLVERRGHWLTGLLKQFRDDRLGLITESAKLGPMVHFRLGTKSVYFLSHPDLIRDMLVTHQHSIVREPTVRRLFEKTMGIGLFTSDGEYWKRQRRMIAPALHRQRVVGYAQTMVQKALDLVERWEDGQSADLELEMDRLTLSIVTAALFRIDSADQAAIVAEAITELQTIGTRQIARSVQLPDWVPTPEHRRQRAASAKLRGMVMAEITERRAKLERGDAQGDDLLSMLLVTEDAETGERMTDEQICSEVITLYLAGYDTTALSLTWSFYRMALDPQIEARFHEELDRVLGGRVPTLDDLERLPYTQGIFKEGLRLYPPAYFAVRSVAEPVEIGGHRIPAGSVLMTSAFAVHRHPDLWDDPERFDPERFADGAEKDWPKFKYFPFGGGPRICIGNQFALAEGPLILATLGQGWRFELPHPDRRVELEPQISLGPKGGMPMRFRRRQGARETALAAAS